MTDSEETIVELAENWLTLTFAGPVTRESALEAVRNIMFLAEQAEELPNPGIRLTINSPGGSIIDGMMLFDVITEIRHNGIPVETGCYGMAASMGGVLLQAGSHRWIGRNSWVMIHNAAFGVQGKTYTVRDELELSEKMEDRLLEIYALRSDGKLTQEEIRKNTFRTDWWLTSEECLEFGVVDEIRAGLPEQLN